MEWYAKSPWGDMTLVSLKVTLARVRYLTIMLEHVTVDCLCDSRRSIFYFIFLNEDTDHVVNLQLFILLLNMHRQMLGVME